ncbi:actin depolymerizing protein [Linnemannia elongata AG-77]|uniref:Actin depolymerizing protein n=1 Tax=Linnemannia elongata AG-77 TaxID=1314771 RepID=A0A197KH10_9FUNG|nr:actin depolymerizing protein [Linnemannia elongata AG-77]
MLKNSTWKLEETNLAEFGGKLEKEHRKEEGALEKAWGKETGVGSQTGLWIWRIEQFQVVPVAKKDYGRFYSGDSYIILNSYQKKVSDVILHDIHFWLGKDTSQDEAGTAAYKTVELDDYLDGKPVQHREVDGFESKQLLSYFKTFSTQSGGVKSGFHHWTEPEYPARLLMVKSAPVNGGHRSSVVVREVAKSMINSGDVFILDTGKVLYQWNGKKSSGIEKVKAAEYAHGIEADRSGDVNVETFDEGERDCKVFWAALGGEVEVKDAEEVAAEPEYVKKLYRLSNASGKLVFTKEGSGPEVNSGLLDSNDVFILDVQHEVFVWVGANANPVEHKNGLHYAQEYLKNEGLPSQTPISKVLEEGDHTMFDNALNRF